MFIQIGGTVVSVAWDRLTEQSFEVVVWPVQAHAIPCIVIVDGLPWWWCLRVEEVLLDRLGVATIWLLVLQARGLAVTIVVGVVL